jgi:hypothetical protein
VEKENEENLYSENKNVNKGQEQKRPRKSHYYRRCWKLRIRSKEVRVALIFKELPSNSRVRIIHDSADTIHKSAQSTANLRVTGVTTF